MHEPLPPAAPTRATPGERPDEICASCPDDAARRGAAERGGAAQAALRRDDPRLGGTVHLAYRDGANLMLPHAFIEDTGDWVFVFTRDHGYFVAHKDSVAACTPLQTAAPWAASERGDGSGPGSV